MFHGNYLATVPMGAMDISVSHLNNRLTFQLPQELPLGLVFVTGTVSFSDSSAFSELVAHGRYKHVHFELIDDKYRMRCVLVVRAMVDYELEFGVRVRVGGHLRFDPQRADYYLLARDLERLDVDLFGEPEESEVDQEEVAALLADIRKRTNQQRIATDLPQSDLPAWVQDLAPQSLQESDSEGNESGNDDSGEIPVEDDMIQAQNRDEKLASSISALLDEVEDVELTPDVIESLDIKEGALRNDELVPVANKDELDRSLNTTAVNGQSWLLWLLVGVLSLLLLFIVVLLIFSL